MVVLCMVQRDFGDVNTNTASKKILFLTLLVMAFVIYTGYNAALISALTVVQFEAPFANVSEALDAGYKFIVVEESATQSEFLLSPLHTPWWLAGQQIMSNKNHSMAKDNSDGLRRLVRDARSVFATISGYIKSSMTIEQHCQVVQIPGEIRSVSVGVGLQKDSEFRELFQYSFQKLRENGIIHLWINELFHAPFDHESCPKDDSIGYDKLVASVVIFASGIGVAMILFTLEFLSVSLQIFR